MRTALLASVVLASALALACSDEDQRGSSEAGVSGAPAFVATRCGRREPLRLPALLRAASRSFSQERRRGSVRRPPSASRLRTRSAPPSPRIEPPSW
jgi:hypothetical protein